MEREKILSYMNNVVANVMKGYQSDFTKYDVPAMMEMESSCFPVIWQVGEYHTYLLRVGKYANSFKDDERLQFEFANDGMPFTYHFECIDYKNDHYFLITEDEIREITPQQCKEVVRDIVTPAVEQFKAEGGSIPPIVKMPIKFVNLSVGELKDIIKKDIDELGGTLLTVLKRFHRWRRTAYNQFIEVYYHKSMNYFEFCQRTNCVNGICGAIKFHGTPETGYLTAGSIQIDPKYGWASHT